MSKFKMLLLKIFFIPIWLLIFFFAMLIFFFAILMYLYDIAGENRLRQLFKDLILELLKYWRL